MEKKAKSQTEKSQSKKTQKKASKTSKKGRIFLGVFLFLFTLIVLCGVAGVLGYRYMLEPVSLSETEIVENPKEKEYIKIENGMSAKMIGDLLQEKGLIKSSDFFYAVIRFPMIIKRQEKQLVLRSGVYDLQPTMPLEEIVNILVEGKEAYVKTSIPEGLTTRKIAKILDDNGVCSFDDFMEVAKSQEILDMIAKYGINALNCEGFLFPDTYYFYPNMNAKDVISVMIKNFFDNMKKLGFEKIPYDKLVLASIVEREYRVDSEAPLIASVFANRIDAKVGLYSCATIEYIITEIQGKPHPDIITYDDLKINSPYNTYKWAALPPAPISNPGLIALKAAMNPPKTDFFYFTLTDSAAGTHTFSKSFKSHVKAGTQFKTKKAN